MSKEFELIQKQMIKTVAIYLLVVILGGFAISGIVQGLLLQLQGFSYNATLLYITGLGAFMTSIGVYVKGKKILSTDA